MCLSNNKFKAIISNFLVSIGNVLLLYYFTHIFIKPKLITKKILMYYAKYLAALFYR